MFAALLLVCNELVVGFKANRVAATVMTRDVKVPDQLFREVRARFSNTEVIELTAAIAAYNMVARFLVATGVQEDEDRKK